MGVQRRGEAVSKDFPVRGLAELDKWLEAFPQRMQKQAYRSALTAAAAPIRDKARELARKRSGAMAKAIKTGSPRQRPDGSFSVRIRLTGKHSFLGLFHEYGVLPHLIASTGKGEGRVAVRKAVAAGKKIGGVLKIGEEFRSGVIHHPGFAAHPFMRPALDMAADAAVQAFADRIRAWLAGKAVTAEDFDEAA